MQSEIIAHIQQHKGLLHIRLTPKASAARIAGFEANAEGQNQLKAYVTDVPENGKANKALIQLLSKHLKLPKSAFEIIRGETDRNKVLRVTI